MDKEIFDYASQAMYVASDIIIYAGITATLINPIKNAVHSLHYIPMPMLKLPQRKIHCNDVDISNIVVPSAQHVKAFKSLKDALRN